MARKPSLTTMQRRILQAMKGGLATFSGSKARLKGFCVLPAKGGGFWIRAYSNPQYFLERRGLIEKQERDVPGTWYRLTETGRAAIEKAAR